MNEIEKPKSLDRIVVDTDRYATTAHELYLKHSDDIYESKTAFPPVYELHDKLKKLSPELLATFWGHGITRGTTEEQIAAVLSVIENSATSGDMGRLAQSGHIDAYTHGCFLVIFDPIVMREFEAKSSAQRRDSIVELVNHDKSINRAMLLKPLAVVTNTHIDSLVPDLKKLYPNFTIITSDEVAGFLSSSINTNNSDSTTSTYQL